MSTPALAGLLPWVFARLLLHAASLAVPAQRRQDWRKEWDGELWQVRNTAASGSAYVQFAWGALPDAVCLHREFPEEKRGLPASRCLLVLFVVALVSVGTALCLPSVRSEFRQASWHTPADLLVLFPSSGPNEATAAVTPERYRVWADRADFLQTIDYYQVERRTVLVNGKPVSLWIAHGTKGMRPIVAGATEKRAGAAFQIPATPASSELILTRQAWRQVFGSDASTRASTDERLVTVDGHAAVILGVANVEDSGLPGAYQAWLFDGEPMRAGVPGFVIGRFAADATTNWYFGFGHCSIRETRDLEASMLLFPVAERKVDPWWAWGIGLALSLLALPATTPLGFGEHVRSSVQTPLRFAFRRWAFLLLKCVLWWTIAAGLALIGGALFSSANWRLAVDARVFVTFLVALLGLRWSIRDQRRRCPACLKPLTHPAQVGDVSKNFLSWSGTELVCDSGHGLMHVPAHATSWFHTQRWLALDASWQFLFAQKP
ncbi:hypothetical protein [Terriglobus sp.]|uniref:hypothetical protein n=1 Tax=Terriglobus sp. TaxID=1889013 RepID=UPI003AFFA441